VIILGVHQSSSFSAKSVPLDILVQVSIAVSVVGNLPLKRYGSLESLGRAVRTAAAALKARSLGNHLVLGPDTYIHESSRELRDSGMFRSIEWGMLGRVSDSLDVYAELRMLTGPAYLTSDRLEDGAFFLSTERIISCCKKHLKNYKKASYGERAEWFCKFLARSKTPWCNADYETSRLKLTAISDRFDFHFGDASTKISILSEHVFELLAEFPQVAVLVQPGTDGDVIIEELKRLTSTKRFLSDLLSETGWQVFEASLEGFLEGVRQVPLEDRTTHTNVNLVLADAASRDSAMSAAFKSTTMLPSGVLSGYSRNQQDALQQLLRGKEFFDFEARLGKAVTDYERIYICLDSYLAPVLRCLHGRINSINHPLTEELKRLSAILMDGTYYRMALVTDPLCEMRSTSLIKERFLDFELSERVVTLLVQHKYSEIDWYSDVYLKYANVLDKKNPLPSMSWERALESAGAVLEMPAVIERILHPLYKRGTIQGVLMAASQRTFSTPADIFEMGQSYFTAGVRKNGAPRDSHFSHYIRLINGAFKEAEDKARRYFSCETPDQMPLGTFILSESNSVRSFEAKESTHEMILDLHAYSTDFFGGVTPPNTSAPDQLANSHASRKRAAPSADTLTWANNNVGLLVKTKRIVVIDTPSTAGLTSKGVTVQLNKDKAAAICGCTVKDRCWWSALSHKDFPAAVICCPHYDKPGHRSATGTQHTFSDSELQALRVLDGLPDFR